MKLFKKLSALILIIGCLFLVACDKKSEPESVNAKAKYEEACQL